MTKGRPLLIRDIMPPYTPVTIDGRSYMRLHNEYKYDLANNVPATNKKSAAISRETRSTIRQEISKLLMTYGKRHQNRKFVKTKKEFKVADFVDAYLIPLEKWNFFISQPVREDHFYIN